jgi:lipopolysaccharide biosynthesis regulator YciM
MQEPLLLIGILLALLSGLAIGKAWERYKLSDGKLIDRRRSRQSPHFILGLNHLVAQQIDLAIDELEKAAQVDPTALEIRLVLGNLYREKGQVGRAIQEHQSLLQRPRLRALEHANVLLCLGLDYRKGGFVDRAVEAFSEVLRLDPKNEAALLNLEKLQEDQHQWHEAYVTRKRLNTLVEGKEQERSNLILAFLENELGLQALKQSDYSEATRRFEAAIELDRTAVPAYLNLGDVKALQGDAASAALMWEEMIKAAPDRAYLAFQRLESIYPKLGAPERFPALCRRIIEAQPLEWRARLALASHVSSHGGSREALDLLFEALVHNPHALAIHQTIWNTLSALGLSQDLVGRYVDITRESVFYLDPHVCMRCRYRSTELLWQCPHCHDWNTFIEERISPAREADEVPTGLMH